MAEPVSPDMPRWQHLRAALDDFRSYLAPNTPPFVLHAANDYWWDDDEYKRLRPAGFPSRMRGVYLMYDDAGELMYVGVALVSFDKRVWSHDDLFASHGVERRWTDVIALEPEYAFLALSLEFFLISRLRPKYNTSYSGYEVPRLGGSADAEPGAAADTGRM
jgi:hypothetical protein